MLQQGKISKVKNVELVLNKAKLNWEEKFKKYCASCTNSAKFDVGQLTSSNLNPQKITYADRENIYKANGNFRAEMFDNDNEIKNIEEYFVKLTGPSPDLKLSKNTQTLMKAIQEEKLHETFKGLKALEIEIKSKIADVMNEGGNKNFMAEGQKLLSQINNTICEYRLGKKMVWKCQLKKNLKNIKIVKKNFLRS